LSVILFCITLGALRTVTNILANAQISLPQALQRGGGVVFGMLTRLSRHGVSDLCVPDDAMA